MISGRTALYGIVGHPVAHSLSPAMQGAALAHLGIDGVYVALPTPPERLQEALRGAHALGFQGLNVTVPHKRGALQACEALDPVARLCGAANTLVRTATGWTGANTDAPATRELLAAAGVGPGARALLLGAGGAARAGAWALADLGCELAVAARRPQAAAELCDALRAAVPAARATPAGFGEAELQALAASADAVVNATSIGLPGHGAPGAPLALRPRAGQVVCDYVYGDTALVAAARAAGARVVTGEAILVRQGALAFALWTGRPAPEAVMAAALRAGRGDGR